MSFKEKVHCSTKCCKFLGLKQKTTSGPLWMVNFCGFKKNFYFWEEMTIKIPELKSCSMKMKLLLLLWYLARWAQVSGCCCWLPLSIISAARWLTPRRLPASISSYFLLKQKSSFRTKIQCFSFQSLNWFASNVFPGTSFDFIWIKLTGEWPRKRGHLVDGENG